MTKSILHYPKISARAYSTLETQENSVHLAFLAESLCIEGDIVECGLGAGANFAFMIIGALSANENTKKTFYGFDSFEGIQLAGPKDEEQAGIGPITHNVNVPYRDRLRSSGVTVHSEDEVRNNLTEWGLWDKARIKLIKGWVQDTLEDNMPDQVSLLRLDMDIYDPTIFALQLMYDRISTGGFIIIDDWALAGVRKAVEEFWQEEEISPVIHHIENSTPIYWVKE